MPREAVQWKGSTPVRVLAELLLPITTSPSAETPTAMLKEPWSNTPRSFSAARAGPSERPPTSGRSRTSHDDLSVRRQIRGETFVVHLPGRPPEAGSDYGRHPGRSDRHRQDDERGGKGSNHRVLPLRDAGEPCVLATHYQGGMPDICRTAPTEPGKATNPVGEDIKRRLHLGQPLPDRDEPIEASGCRNLRRGTEDDSVQVHSASEEKARGQHGTGR